MSQKMISESVPHKILRQKMAILESQLDAKQPEAGQISKSQVHTKHYEPEMARY